MAKITQPKQPTPPQFLTYHQQEHLYSIIDRFSQRVHKKYVKGQAEHGGNLWEKQNFTSLIEEVIDMVTYLHCVEDDLRVIKLTVIELRKDTTSSSKKIKQHIKNLERRLHIK
jgi:hypothetical protein